MGGTADVIAPEEVAAALLPKLRSGRITYFPIRHHSPACAIHIERWILKNKPEAVLVEGPSSFTSRIEALTDETCKCPVALYTNFVDKKGRIKAFSEEAVKAEEPSQSDKKKSPFDLDLAAPRFAAYYPFCDYSPEMVALRTGKRVGARLRFIDLEYGESVLKQFEADRQKPDLLRVELLSQDPHLLHSRYIKGLAEQLGCRDFDELWDHLFETGWEHLSTDAFIDRLATYCAMARLDYSIDDLTADATIAREECMASAIVDELERTCGKILVVTGGFHTVTLPDLVAEKKQNRPSRVEFRDDESGVWLMRYSFNKLDSLSGYSAGMPSPAFYDRLWNAARESTDEKDRSKIEKLENVAADVLVEIGRLTRELKLANLISTPDAIAAVQMTKQLAALRGHPWPMREDILDGVRSCFVKGEINVEGQVILKIVRNVLAGDRVGQIPAGSDLPPIVADFHREAKRLRVAIDQIEKKEYSLELYRNANHRGISRFFHRLNFLGSTFARFISGPDFVVGQKLDLMQEHWETSWSPLAESALIESSVFGATIEEATANRLTMLISELDENAQARSTEAAVTLLIRACRLGLHSQSAAMVPLIDVHIAEDPHILSVTTGLSQLELLQSAREPLEAFHLTAVPSLMQAAYQRACRLLLDLAHCPDSVVAGGLRAIQILREVLSNCALDSDLYFQGLASILTCPPHEAQSPIVGAAAGILYAEGKLSEQDLISLVCGFLGGAINDPKKSAGILRGLLATACEVAWQVTEIIKALDNQFQSWDESIFLELLPEMRLAFSALTPRDIARVAESVSVLHGGEELGELIHTDIDEADVRLGLSLNERVRNALRADGLEAT